MADEAFDESRLPEDAAHRLLARAVELDATRSAELTIAQLRAAATDAGISDTAFDAALKEWRSVGRAQCSHTTCRLVMDRRARSAMGRKAIASARRRVW